MNQVTTSATSATAPMQRLSIIIPNYNYAAYIGEAIDSALAVQWPDKEIIVVDDGSTDDSRRIISEYGDRITAIFKDNGGQYSAGNVGYAASSGDVVIFLDSDDALLPNVATLVQQVWHPGVSKVQFPMITIDADGSPTGQIYPDLAVPPTPVQIRHWMTSTTEYPTPPGSGNAYSRNFLDRLFPLDYARCGRAIDSPCLAAAPYLGDVVSISTPAVKYRRHGANISYLLASDTTFSEQVGTAVHRHEYSREVAGLPPDLAPLRRGRHLLQLRVANHRLRPDLPAVPGDCGHRLLIDTIRSPFSPGPESARYRLAVAGWCAVALAAPRPVATRLITARFAQGKRKLWRRGVKVPAPSQG
ncbi:glycosyltransferase family A protein [Branchiibius sp. NY16-3462-2]|uniref:glycosyltransferase family 2 protein n=1 Tax=Branchiibius sp. NY16-3462-2 TaxID=1807500 RepID=UPI00079A33F0|nr:glycosyltransferase family A protein [Branchiibius sp. NY16-3462-2]KYH44971.1 hypothetical protein AZH51_13815 [Branchiibius sp. NY16-3462-2]